MDRVLLTGATGLVGRSILDELLARNYSVRALVRSRERAEEILGPSACELAVGDVTDADSIDAAIEGCSIVYHAAGLPEQWLADDSRFAAVNVGGTRNMVEAALAARVEKFVYSSTIDVFAGRAGEPFDESVIDPQPKGTAYERSKQDADQIVSAAMERGLPAVFLHPSAVFGPITAGSPGLNDFVDRILRREIPMLLPGGMPVVYAPDVARGHVDAAEIAPIGSRFILSDRYFDLAELAGLVVDVAGTGKVPPVLPLALARVVSSVGEKVADWTRKPPLIPSGQLHFLCWRARPSAALAEAELGWTTTPLRAALEATVEFLRS
jgi:dihydroflavonol-4-reductase